jgi:hypothetical protein
MPAWQVRLRMRLRNFPLHPMHEKTMPEVPQARPPSTTQSD